MNENFSRLLCCLFLILCTLSCKKNEDKGYILREKIYEFQKQGWKSSNASHYVNDITYSATEVPLQYYLLKNTKNNASVDSLYETMKSERVLEVEFQHNDKADLLLQEYTNKDYEESVKYLSENIKTDFRLITSQNDTIDCSGVHFERNFKLAPFKRVLLYFNGVPPEDTIKLIYNDHLFGNGIFKFNFNNSPIKL